MAVFNKQFFRVWVVDKLKAKASIEDFADRSQAIARFNLLKGSLNQDYFTISLVTCEE